MNKLQIFESTDFGTVRTVLIDKEPYFVGKDVAEILGYRNPNEAIQDMWMQRINFCVPSGVAKC